jgi:hypothetical protein
MEFYGRIIEVNGDFRPILIIKERDSESIWRISLNDIHCQIRDNSHTIIIDSGNLLTDNMPEEFERFLILEIRITNSNVVHGIISQDSYIDAQVFVHTPYSI